MILEDVSKITKKDRLAKIGNNMFPAIKADISKIQNTKIPLFWNEKAKEKYNDYIGEFLELKKTVAALPKDTENLSYENKAAIKKILIIWEAGYNKLKELEEAINDYNERFPNNKLKCLEELTGKKPTPSVKTDYFGY